MSAYKDLRKSITKENRKVLKQKFFNKNSNLDVYFLKNVARHDFFAGWRLAGTIHSHLYRLNPAPGRGRGYCL